MNVSSYYWSDEASNMVGISLREGDHTVLVWADEDFKDLEGVNGSGKVYDTLDYRDKTAFALGVALKMMISGENV